MSSFQAFGPGAWLFIGIYLFSLILIGLFAFKARKENTLNDFYLAGNSFGLVVIFLTLYATQYSGNTLFGFSGKTYRIGFSWIMSLQFMIAIVYHFCATPICQGEALSICYTNRLPATSI